MLAQSKDKETALFMAVENNQLKAVVYLLEHREGRTPYNPNDVNHLGDTILHKAAKQGFTNLTAYLLVVDGMDVDSRNL
jgi:ankyrin repeat protein